MTTDTPPASYDEAIAYLDGFVNFERLPVARQLAKGAITLERVRELADMLGRPADGVRAVHIAGSKGKGSTAAILESILRADGLRTGLYVSPHLTDVRERIQLGGEPIARGAFTSLIARLHPQLEAYRNRAGERRVTYFEVLTHLAFQFFADEAVDAAVIETGMGGRLDATTICTPVACGITQIELEHTRQLGETHGAIAAEKAGILKPGVPAVAAPGNPEAAASIEAVAKSVGAPLLLLGRDFHLDEPADSRGAFGIRLPGAAHRDLRLPNLLGAHQRRNAAAAAALATLAGRAGIGSGSDIALREGLRAVRWPGRLEPVDILGGPGLLDGAHTVASVRAALDACAERHAGAAAPVAVFGTHEDKDAAGMLALLSARAKGIVLTGTGSERALPPHTLAEAAGGVPVAVEPDAGDALRAARSMAGPDGPVLVLGSLYLVGRVIKALQAADGGSRK